MSQQRLRAIISIAFTFVITFPAAVLGEDRGVTYETIVSADGLPLVVASSGRRDGVPIVFVHGYAQSLDAWEPQLNDVDLQQHFYMVAIDLRGHGASAKPWAASYYENQDWADDVARIIEEKDLRAPILVGWSFGGAVLSAYVRHYGHEAISGLVFVAGAMSFAAPQAQPDLSGNDLPPELVAALERRRMMESSNTQESIAGTLKFIDSLTHKPLSAEERQKLLAINMMTPAYVRKVIVAGLDTYEDLAGEVDIDILFIHGDDDAIIPSFLSEANVQLFSNADLKIYSDVGHSPFIEEPRQFKRDLVDFAGRATPNRDCQSC